MENIYQLLDKIKSCPIMYLGKNSITALKQFLGGYSYALHSFGIDNPEMPPFVMFHEWSAYRFKWSESTAGWKNIILEECEGDEARALDVFYQVLEDFKRLVPIAITKVIIQQENRAFYYSPACQIKRGHPSRQTILEKEAPDSIYLIEFSDLFGYYNYWVQGIKVLDMDRWRYKQRIEALKQIKMEFGENLYMVEIERGEVERVFEKLVMGS
ncbi:hypothetical protein [Xanthocytophaga flava]|nr:hypothetical protein [Xanthocytophaga flavus]